MPAERCPYLCDSLKGSEGTSCVPKYKRAQRRSSSRRGAAERRWAVAAASALTGCGSKSNAPVANENGVVESTEQT
ncbi:hypothetical protein [Faecalibacterium sp. An77]|uniref:hypothetical protein n=1 Tax=Faecalibacterium sp. An77 TaxID=1965655 RepID=UPI001FA850E1|nr:hypothetical protein [Faecalibacterium sp. An77]